MPLMNFRDVPYPSKQDHSPLEPGQYRVKCIKCEVTFNEAGIEVWKLTHEVCDGPRAGRWVFDQMPWGSTKSEKANLQSLSRCKMICHRMGGLRVDEIGELDVRPHDLMGKTAVVTVELVQQDWKTGELLPPDKQKNRIVFDGYDFDGPEPQVTDEPAAPPEREPGVDDGDVPF